MPPRTYLVVGASRGIGLALVSVLLTDPTARVLAAARAPARSPGLQTLAAAHPPERLALLTLDVTDPASVARAAVDAAAVLGGDGDGTGLGLDCLIHNAAISLQELTPFEHVDLGAFEHELRTNTVAPLLVARAFLPLLRLGRARSSSSSSNAPGQIVFVSSSLASLAHAPEWAGLSDTYAVTKAGLGMLARKWGPTLKDEGIFPMVLHPGWVDTDMGNTIRSWVAEHAPHFRIMSARECAERCMRVIRDARPEDAVSFYAYDGSIIPW